MSFLASGVSAAEDGCPFHVLPRLRAGEPLINPRGSARGCAARHCVATAAAHSSPRAV